VKLQDAPTSPCLAFRLRDICEELLTVVAEVMVNELTFLRLVGTVSRGDSSIVSLQCCILLVSSQTLVII